MPEFVGTLAVQIIVAVIAAYTTVRFSIRAFASQKWWERKAEAYSSIVEALSNELGETWRLMDEEERRAAREEDRSTTNKSPDRIDRRREAQRKINQAAAMGAFIISDEAAKHLNTLRSELATARDATGFYEFLEAEYTAMNKCLSALRGCAHVDLGVPRRFWRKRTSI